MVDKNLFLYDLAVVAIMKDEEPYVQEWLDYHLLAGVDHFYIYDNESTPEFKKILQPYINAGIVTYIYYPGKARQMEAYNDAVQKFRFESRYIAFIDGDEFIFPKSKSTITEVVNEILSASPFEGLLMKWMLYGSNGQEKADFSRGVLERFTKRDSSLNDAHKYVGNPRSIDFFWTPHFPVLLDESLFLLNDEIAEILNFGYTVSEKIVVNHYFIKSREEYENKSKRGDASFYKSDKYDDKLFKSHDKNEVFDDGILNYIDSRLDALTGTGGGGYDGINTLIESKKNNYAILLKALTDNLSTKNFENKVENFLTCLHLSGYLRGKLFDDDGAKIFEENSLNALYNSMHYSVSVTDILLLFDELPKILKLNYAVVKKIYSFEIELMNDFSQILLSVVKETKRLKFWRLISRLKKSSEILKAVS